MTMNGNATREVLLDAAERLFSERGYAAVGIREIAETAGVNLASINYHFGSKRELYLATVRRAMGSRGDNNPWTLFSETPGSREEATTLLCRFIHRFMKQLLPIEGVDACGTLIIREGLEPTEALDAVITEYLQPNEELLRNLLRIIVPEATESELGRYVVSILGQMVHYRLFRPIIERLWDDSLSETTQLATIADHIAAYSLRGMGCEQWLITRAINAASTFDAPVDSASAGSAQSSSTS